MSVVGGNLNQPLTQDEKKFYGQIFKTLDPKHSGSISGLTAKPLLEASNLPLPLLGEIWSIADPENSGTLNQFGFCVAMRLIGHVQNGATLTPDLAHKVSPQLAKFNSIPMTPSGTGISTNNTGSRVSSVGSTVSHQQLMVPVLLPQQATNFASMFDKSAPDGVLGGVQARDIFLKARLPTQILEKIWNLVDQQQLGQLTKPQFIVAMHLIQSFLNKSMTILPTIIPEQIWETAKTFDQRATHIQQQVPESTVPPVLAQAPNRPAPAQRETSTGSTNLNTWIMSPEQKQQYGAVFESLDKQKQGLITGNDVATFLMTSKLGNDVLASIWELANLDGSDTFDKQEFSIAMYLVQKKIAGFELPEETPTALIESSSLGVRQASVVIHPPQQGVSQPPQQLHQQAASQPPIQQVNQSKSHLYDLMDVFGISSAVPAPGQAAHDQYRPPVPPAPISRASSLQQHQPLSSSVTGGRAAFVPTSSFGQKLQNDQIDEVEESSDDDEGPQILDSKIYKSAPPAIPGRDHKPQFDSPSPVQPQQVTGPNYGALREANNQVAPAQISSQPSEGFFNQATNESNSKQSNEFFTQFSGGFSSQPAAGFSNQPAAGGFSAQSNDQQRSIAQGVPVPVASISAGSVDREVTNRMSQATVDIANFSNQINSLATQTTNISAKKERSQKELNRILRVKEGIEAKLIQLRTLYEREVQQVKEVENVLIESNTETEKLNQELSLVEATYHSEQAKMQQIQLQFEESQKANQTKKEKLGVMNAESIDLRQQLEDLTNKLKQSENMLHVTEGQIATQEQENQELRYKIQSLTNSISELEAKHSQFLSRSNQLEDENMDLYETHGDLSAQHAEKNLEISTALASGAGLLAGAAAIGLGAKVLLSRETEDPNSQVTIEESEEVPTASLEDFDDDDFPVPTSQDKREAIESPSNTTSGFGSTAKSASDTATAQTSEFQYDTGQGQQQFSLPFGIPHSETSSIQNNPSQSVRGDPDIPESPTSTIEEEAAAPPPTILSSQIMPESANDNEDQELTGSSSNENGESFEILNHKDAEEIIINPPESELSFAEKEIQDKEISTTASLEPREFTMPGSLPGSMAGEVDGPAETLPTEEESVNTVEEPGSNLEKAPLYSDSVTQNSISVEETPQDATPMDSNNVIEPLSSLIETAGDAKSEADSAFASAPATADVERTFPEIDAPALTKQEEYKVPTTADATEAFPEVSIPKTADFENAVPELEQTTDGFSDSFAPVTTSEAIPTNSSSAAEYFESELAHATETVDDFESELAPAAETADEFPEVDDSTKELNAGFSSLKVADEFPPIKELQPAEDDDSSSDDEEFHDSISPPAQAPPMKEASAPTPAGAATSNTSFNPFTMTDLQPAAVTDADEFENLQFDGFSKGAQTQTQNMFDDLGLEEAQEQSYENLQFDQFNNFGTTGFSFSPSEGQAAAAGSGSGSDEWEQVFAGFGNGPPQAVAPTGFDAPPSYDFSNGSGSAAEAQPTFEKNAVVADTVGSSPYSQSQLLAIEELQGMGFDEASVVDALKKNNWQLDLATNFLLDSA